VAQRAKDCIVDDVDGNQYIDFNSGLVAMNVGHSHSKVVEAVRKQAGEFMHYSYTDSYYPHVVELAETFLRKTPGRFEKKLYFANSGAESIEAAIKVTKWHTGKHRFLAFISAFHGRTIGAVSLTSSKPTQVGRFFPMMPGVTHVPYPYCYRCPFKMTYSECGYHCVDFIDEMVLHRYVPPEEVAAIFFEPIQGEGGYVVPPEGYFQRLRKLADKYGILLVDDEVQTGMARSGRWFAIEHWRGLNLTFCVLQRP
jgi:4-aminobutyrate aminotransferase